MTLARHVFKYSINAVVLGLVGNIEGGVLLTRLCIKSVI